MADPEETRTDEELVELVLAGEGEVFACLYERYYSRAYRLAYAMTGHKESAEDLTQEVFLRTYQKIERFGGQSSFSTWFYRLAVNCCLNYRNKLMRQLADRIDDRELPNIPGGAKRMESEVLQKQIRSQIHSALLGLKPRLRMMVILKDIEGLSYEEIAERAGCSKGTVASRLNRARKLLAGKLKHLRGTL
ncbi:MAG: sigma-70 family RNA polymerase sigma factor [Blastocatellia bacterium]|nr:sigma-70 family RNA polymerase sigma factor [Blastocatellia bacterium]